MKTLRLLFIAFTISISASAQVHHDTLHSNTHHDMDERYSVRNGKIIWSRNGTQSEVTQEARLNNGTTLTPEGKLTRKNGKIESLKEGDWLDMNGTVHSKK